MTPDEGPVGAEQYFAEHPHARPDRRELRFLYRGELLSFVVDTGVFASHRLDPGTALLIENLGLRPTDRVLDLGCGWGAVGVAAARSAPRGEVVLTDVNRRAARLAEENLSRNAARNASVRVGRLFEPVSGMTFDVVATNPPFRAGREVVLGMLAAAPAYLAPGGRLLVVGKGGQGIRYYQAWLASHWAPGVRVLARGSGYRVLEAAAPTPGPAEGAAGGLLAEGVKNRRSLGRRPRAPSAPRSTRPRRAAEPGTVIGTG
ncbi:MAG TPA: methyltransferase [Thermoplasmata archaeon]|nr:methyltransferase [Thermoplasmata archaeon]